MPERSDFFPNSAFQVTWDGETPLSWTLFGETVVAYTGEVGYCDGVTYSPLSNLSAVIQRDEPVLECPVGMTFFQIHHGSYILASSREHLIERNFDFNLPIPGNDGVLRVWSMVGSPDRGCPYSDHPWCSADQDSESFNIFVNDDFFMNVPDHGNHQWKVFDFSLNLPAGEHEFTFRHINPLGTGQDSVHFKAGYCVPTEEVDPPVTPLLECVAAVGENEFVAHFGYRNHYGSAIYEPEGIFNSLTGGGLSSDVLSAEIPNYFAYPNVVPGDPGRSANFPYSAFQIPFDGNDLDWTLYSQTVSANSESTPCIFPQGYGLGNYANEMLGIPPEDLPDFFMDLFNEGDDPLEALRIQLRNYLNRSASDPDFDMVAVASSGNFRPWFQPSTGTPVPPLAPASWDETVSIGATLIGDNLWEFSHDSEIATVGGAFELSPNSFLMGTSFSSPIISRIYAGYLTFPNGCNFVQVSGIVVPPVFNPGVLNNSLVNLSLPSPFNCDIPTVVDAPFCFESEATIYVDPETNRIVGGPDDGKTYNGRINGTNGDDVIVGGHLNDRINGRNGNDIICGLGGHDTINGNNGDDTIDGGDDNDRINGGNGMDTAYGGEGNDRIRGNNDNDWLNGGPGRDNIRGGNGDDHIDGGDDRDDLRGGNGNDVIGGGDGDDTIRGDRGDYDRMFGGDGEDDIRDHDGALGAHGGPGDDYISIRLRNGWVDNNGNFRFDGKLSGGYGNDFVKLDIRGSNVFFINITGDERDDPPSPLEGDEDQLDLRGNINPGSVIIKFELDKNGNPL